MFDSGCTFRQGAGGLLQNRQRTSFRRGPGGGLGGGRLKTGVERAEHGGSNERFCGQRLPTAAFFGSFLVRTQEMNTLQAFERSELRENSLLSKNERSVPQVVERSMILLRCLPPGHWPGRFQCHVRRHSGRNRGRTPRSPHRCGCAAGIGSPHLCRRTVRTGDW